MTKADANSSTPSPRAAPTLSVLEARATTTRPEHGFVLLRPLPPETVAKLNDVTPLLRRALDLSAAESTGTVYFALHDHLAIQSAAPGSWQAAGESDFFAAARTVIAGAAKNERPANEVTGHEMTARALLMLKEEPDVTDAEIARRLGCHRSTIGRLPMLKAARARLRLESPVAERRERRNPTLRATPRATKSG